MDIITFIWSILQECPLKLDKEINIGTTQHTKNYKGIFLKYSWAGIHYNLNIDVLISQMKKTQRCDLGELSEQPESIFYFEIFRLILAHFLETWLMADTIINGKLHSGAGWWRRGMWHNDTEMVSPDRIHTSCKACAYASNFKLRCWGKNTRAADGIPPSGVFPAPHMSLSMGGGWVMLHISTRDPSFSCRLGL